MPRTGAPPMIGDTPTTVFWRTASAIPGTARMVPMLTTGLDGGSRTASAAAIASRTPGAGVAACAPVTTMSAAGTAACSRTHHSWKCTVRWPVAGRAGGPSCRITWVSTGSSDMGMSVTPGCHRWQSAAVAADRGRPSPSMLVRAMWVAKSRSPRLNQSGPTPIGGEFLQDRECLVGAAPALLLADPAAERVHHGVQVRGDMHAEQVDVVTRVADDGDLGVRGLGLQPAQEAGGPDSAGEHGDAHVGKSRNPLRDTPGEPPGKPGAPGF